jgi:hypothetical protein
MGALVAVADRFDGERAFSFERIDRRYLNEGVGRALEDGGIDHRAT